MVHKLSASVHGKKEAKKRIVTSQTIISLPFRSLLNSFYNNIFHVSQAHTHTKRKKKEMWKQKKKEMWKKGMFACQIFL